MSKRRAVCMWEAMGMASMRMCRCARFTVSSSA